jgi:hypothetical protein
MGDAGMGLNGRMNQFLFSNSIPGLAQQDYNAHVYVYEEWALYRIRVMHASKLPSVGPHGYTCV